MIQVNEIAFEANKITDAELGKFIKFLMKHDYYGTFTFDGMCYIIEYEYNPSCGYGTPYIKWVNDEV